ncbi:MAG: hypothetical protein V4560_12890 [Bacteroidota bacterium]
MNKLFLSVILLFFAIGAFAQKNTFGIVSYTVPAGYELIKNDNVLTYYKEDKSTGAYCNFFVYKLTPGKGEIQQDFDFSWGSQVQKPFKVTGTANMQPVATLKGWQFLMGTTKYADNGIATLAMLITFSGENKMQSICILSNSDQYKNDIENFIASVDVAREIAPTGDKPVASGFNETNSITSLPGNIKYEVWECNCPNLATNTQVTTKLNTVVLSPDGKYLTHMPTQGLNGVTPQNSNETGSWGNVTDKGNMLSLVNDKYGKMELYKIDVNTRSRYPNSKSSIYKKVKPVDGLRFEGAYSPELSYYNGKTDIISRQTDPNKRPIIFFKKDGTYINEGIGFSNITRNDDFAIGKGTYEIVNYSLILITQTRRKLQVAFTPVLDADPTSVDNGGLIINNNLFWRLNKTFVPHN